MSSRVGNLAALILIVFRTPWGRPRSKYMIKLEAEKASAMTSSCVE